MKNPWKTLSSEKIYRTKWFSVREDKIVRPDGKTSTYSVISAHPAVFVVPVDDHNRIGMVSELRYTTGQTHWELPAGNTDGRDPLEAAKHELKEEAGLIAGEWQILEPQTYPYVGACDQFSYVIVAQDLKLSDPERQGDESIGRLQFLSWAEIDQMILSGKITSGESISSLFIARLWLDKKPT